METSQKAAPSTVKVAKDRCTLSLLYPGGSQLDFPAEMLRVFSPSAEVQGHNPSERKLVAGKQKVMIIEVKPVGNYAIRLTFDDMHSTGIYSWDFFAGLNHEREGRWAAYLAELEAKGLSRG